MVPVAVGDTKLDKQHRGGIPVERQLEESEL